MDSGGLKMKALYL